MSTAPRTDEVERDVPENADICIWWHEMDQHARQLETELVASQNEIQRLTDVLHAISDESDYRNIKGTIQHALKR